MLQEILFESSKVSFEFQNWPVYRRAIEFSKSANDLCLSLPDGMRDLKSQLRRASSSVPLNIAEGSSRFSRNDKLSFLRISRGSVFECAAILDLVREIELIEGDKHEAMMKALQELGKMLSGFIRHVQMSNFAKEKALRLKG